MGKKNKAKKQEIIYVFQERRQEKKAFEANVSVALDMDDIGKLIKLIWKALGAAGLDASDSDVRTIAEGYLDGDY
jgi:hypothetical protein